MGAYSRESDLRQLAAFTPEEEEDNYAYETSPDVEAEFRQAIALQQDPQKRAVLQASYDQDFGGGLERGQAADPLAAMLARARGDASTEVGGSSPALSGDDPLAAVVARARGVPDAPEEDGDFVRSVKNYLPQTKELLGAGQALLGEGIRRTFGEGEVGNYLRQGGLERMAAAKKQQVGKESDSLSNALDKGLITTVTDWAPYAAGQVVTNVGESIVAAVLGSLVGGATAGPAGAAGGAATGAFAKSMLRKELVTAAEKIMLTKGEDAAKLFVAKELGKSGGVLAMAGVHGVGEVGSRAIDEAKGTEGVDFSTALPAMVGHMGLEYWGDKIALNALLKKGEGGDLLRAGYGTLAKKMTGGFAEVAAKEIPVEMGQTGMERYGAGLSLTDSAARREYFDAGGAAGMFGFVGAGGAARNYRSQTYSADQAQAATTLLANPDAPIEARMQAAHFLGRVESRDAPTDLLQQREDILRDANGAELDTAAGAYGLEESARARQARVDSLQDRTAEYEQGAGAYAPPQEHTGFERREAPAETAAPDMGDPVAMARYKQSQGQLLTTKERELIAQDDFAKSQPGATPTILSTQQQPTPSTQPLIVDRFGNTLAQGEPGGHNSQVVRTGGNEAQQSPNVAAPGATPGQSPQGAQGGGVQVTENKPAPATSANAPAAQTKTQQVRAAKVALLKLQANVSAMSNQHGADHPLTKAAQDAYATAKSDLAARQGITKKSKAAKVVPAAKVQTVDKDGNPVGLTAEDIDLSSTVVSAAAKKRKAVFRGEMDKPALSALRTLLTGKVTEAAQLMHPKAAALFAEIHDLVSRRDKLTEVFSKGRYYYPSKGPNGERVFRRKPRETLYTVPKDAATESVDTFYTARRDELKDVTRQLTAKLHALEGEVGFNNIQAAQKLDKSEKGKQSREATLFSSMYRDFNDESISADQPFPNRADKDIRERQELKSFTNTKLASVYTDGFRINANQTMWKGVDAILMKIRHHGNNPFMAHIASRLYHIIKDARKDESYVDPKMFFYTKDGLSVVNENGTVTHDSSQMMPKNADGTTSKAKVIFAPDGSAEIHVGPEGQSAEIVLHELIHHVLAGYIAKHADKPAVVALNDLRKWVIKSLKAEKSLSPELSTILTELEHKDAGIQEFLSYGLTNHDLQMFMKRPVAVPKGNGAIAFMKSSWNAFASLVRNMLGITEDSPTAFNAFLATSGHVLTFGYHEGYKGGDLQSYHARAASPDAVTAKSVHTGALSRVMLDPTRQEVSDKLSELKKAARESGQRNMWMGTDLRALVHSVSGRQAVWPAAELEHDEVATYLGWPKNDLVHEYYTGTNELMRDFKPEGMFAGEKGHGMPTYRARKEGATFAVERSPSGGVAQIVKDGIKTEAEAEQAILAAKESDAKVMQRFHMASMGLHEGVRGNLMGKEISLRNYTQFGDLPSGSKLTAYDIHDDEGNRVGEALLGVDRNGKITDISNVEFDRTLQGNGLGEKFVRSVLASSPEGVIFISDTLPDSVPFWEKMGVRWTTDKKEHGNGILDIQDYEAARPPTGVAYPTGYEGSSREALRSTYEANQRGSGGSGLDFTFHAKGEGSVADKGYTEFAPTKPWAEDLFRMVAPGLWGKDPKAMNALEKLGASVQEGIQKRSPWLAKQIGYWYAPFNVSPEMEAIVQNYKKHRNAPSTAANEFGKWVQSKDSTQVAEVMEAFNYMDHPDQPTKLTADVKMKVDAAREALLTAVAKSKRDVREQFGQLLPSEMLTLALQADNVAASSFGAREGKLLGAKLVFPLSEGAIAYEGEGAPRGKFYPEVVNGQVARMVHEVIAKRTPDQFDMLHPYLIQKLDKSATKVSGEAMMQFRALTTAKALLSNKSMSHDTADKIATGFLNTVSLLSNAVATRQLSRDMATVGAMNGKVFESKSGLLAHLQKTDPKKASVHVTKLTGKETKNKTVESKLREPGNWVQMPSSDAYGDLKDKIIEGPMWARIQDAIHHEPMINSQAYNSLMTMFKSAKTVYNPATAATNIMSNFTLSYLHNISFSTNKEALSLYVRYKTRPATLSARELEIMSEFHKSGATLGDFSTNEIRQLMHEAYAEKMESSGVGYMNEFAAWSKYENSLRQKAVEYAKRTGKNVNDVMTDVYATGDNMFRLAAFMHEMGRLQNEHPEMEHERKLDQAGTFAKKAFLDYDIDSKAVQALRQTFLPFFAWPYAFSGVIAKIAKNEPWKIATLATVYAIASSALGGDDSEEERKERKRAHKDDTTWFGANKEWKIGTTKDGKSVYFNAARWFMPTPLEFKESPNGFMGWHSFPSAIAPNNPLLTSMIYAYGTDPYTGKPIHKDTNTDLQNTAVSLGKIYNQFTPSWANEKILGPKKGLLGHDGDTTLHYTKMFLAPVTTVDKQEAAKSLELEINRTKRAFDTEIAAQKRAQLLGKSDPESKTKVIEALRAREKEKLDKLREAK